MNAVRVTVSLITVVGDDLIPRTSHESLYALRESIIVAIEQCNRAKYEILLKGCFKLLCGGGFLTSAAVGERTRIQSFDNPQLIVDDQGEYCTHRTPIGQTPKRCPPMRWSSSTALNRWSARTMLIIRRFQSFSSSLSVVNRTLGCLFTVPVTLCLLHRRGENTIRH